MIFSHKLVLGNGDPLFNAKNYSFLCCLYPKLFWFENANFSVQQTKLSTPTVVWAPSIMVGNLLLRSSLICSDCSNQMSNCEQFAQITQDKWATLSRSLRSLMSKEWPWANCSGHSGQMSDHEQFAQVAHMINERMSKLLFFWANCSFAFLL